MTLGEKIKYIRVSRNLTQENLAESSGISIAAIKKYETGERNPKLNQLLKISNVLGISMNFFVDLNIQTVSDVLSLIFKMDEQIDINITADKKENGSYDANTVSISFKNKILNQNLCAYLTAIDNIKNLPATTQVTELMNAKVSLESIKQHLLDDNTLLNSNKHLTGTLPSKEHLENMEILENFQKLLLNANDADKTWALDILTLISKKLK